MQELKVLDHGFVRLLSYMQPVPVNDNRTEDGWTGDLEVVRNARVSFDADWRAGADSDKDDKLLKYMLTNKHTSPFEAMVFTFEIKAPIFVVRQWHRHRTWSYNEVSARYTELPEEFYIPQLTYVGRQSKTNKQQRNIDPTVDWTVEDEWFLEDLQSHSVRGFRFYQKHLAIGIPRELARCFLGLNTYTRFHGTVDLHNLMHFLRLRLHPHAQYEIRQYAEKLLALITPIVPVSVKHFAESR